MTEGAAVRVTSAFPCAEIAMIVVHQGRQLGDRAVREEVYAGAVFVAMATCIGAPLKVERLLRRGSQATEAHS